MKGFKSTTIDKFLLKTKVEGTIVEYTEPYFVGVQYETYEKGLPKQRGDLFTAAPFVLAKTKLDTWTGKIDETGCYISERGSSFNPPYILVPVTKTIPLVTCDIEWAKANIGKEITFSFQMKRDPDVKYPVRYAIIKDAEPDIVFPLMMEKLLKALGDSPNYKACLTLHETHKDRLYQSPGSSFKHQAYIGGYGAHIYQTFILAEKLYETLNKFKSLDFSLGDALLTLFLHDIEKPFKYVDPKIYDGNKVGLLKNLVITFDLQLSESHWNALVYTHGEPDSEYNAKTMIQGPLAAFIHMCDVASARIFYNVPK